MLCRIIWQKEHRRAKKEAIRKSDYLRTMSFWHRILEAVSGEGGRPTTQRDDDEWRNSSLYAFVDLEVGINDKAIHDIGALRWDGATMHTTNKTKVLDFIKDAHYLCGHNIIHHDAK